MIANVYHTVANSLSDTFANSPLWPLIAAHANWLGVDASPIRILMHNTLQPSLGTHMSLIPEDLAVHPCAWINCNPEAIARQDWGKALFLGATVNNDDQGRPLHPHTMILLRYILGSLASNNEVNHSVRLSIYSSMFDFAPYHVLHEPDDRADIFIYVFFEHSNGQCVFVTAGLSRLGSECFEYILFCPAAQFDLFHELFVTSAVYSYQQGETFEMDRVLVDSRGVFPNTTIGGLAVAPPCSFPTVFSGERSPVRWKLLQSLNSDEIGLAKQIGGMQAVNLLHSLGLSDLSISHRNSVLHAS